jgi:hypothetical protein
MGTVATLITYVYVFGGIDVSDETTNVGMVCALVLILNTYKMKYLARKKNK